jgi:hypothetical protein
MGKRQSSEAKPSFLLCYIRTVSKGRLEIRIVIMLCLLSLAKELNAPLLFLPSHFVVKTFNLQFVNQR